MRKEDCKPGQRVKVKLTGHKGIINTIYEPVSVTLDYYRDKYVFTYTAKELIKLVPKKKKEPVDKYNDLKIMILRRLEEQGKVYVDSMYYYSGFSLACNTILGFIDKLESEEKQQNNKEK